MTKSNLFLSAAVVGILSAGTAQLSLAADAKMEASPKGHCVGANACKGHGGCKQEGKNECAGKNGCKGKSFVEKTKAECDTIAKNEKGVRFEAVKK